MGVFLSKFKEIYFPKPNTQKKRPDVGLRRFRRRKSFKYQRKPVQPSKNYKSNPMSDYQAQNTQFPTHNIGTSGVLHANSMFDDFLNSIENDLKIKDEKFTNQDKDRLKIKDGLHEDRKWYDEEYPSLVRKVGYFEEAKQAIEDTYERLKHTTAFQPRDFHSSPYHYHPPPAYHPPAPAYHPPAPSTPPYKAVYEVDFTPIFLTLLPIMMVLGTLLGLSFSGLLSQLTGSSSTTTIVTAANTTGSGTGSGVTVNVSSNNSATATVQGSNVTTGTNLGFLPILNNGTLTFLPFINTGFNTGFANIGLGGLFGFGNLGGIIFGRSFSSTYFHFLSEIFSIFFQLVEHLQDENEEQKEEGDYIYMEPDWY